MKKFTVKIQQVFSQEQEARLQGIYDMIFDLIDKEAENTSCVNPELQYTVGSETP